MTQRIKPLLALKCPKDMPLDEFIDKAIPIYPVLATPKIDFIRCYTTASTSTKCNDYTRSRKEIPNRYIHKRITQECPPYIDGELGVGKTFQDGTSGIMSYEGEPNFTYHIFDCYINGPSSYAARMECLDRLFLPDFCVKLLPRLIADKEQLYHFEKWAIESLGAEGICVRPLNSPYIVGTADNRAVFNRPYLVAICRWVYSEARIIGFNEEYFNDNEPETDYLGHAKRPSLKEGMIAAGRLGSLRVKNLEDGIEFNVGSGFTHANKRYIWTHQKEWLGRIIRYKWKKHGTLNKPRIPIYDTVRDERDL